MTFKFFMKHSKTLVIHRFFNPIYAILRKNMSTLSKVIPAPERSIPLFIDVHAETYLAGAFLSTSMINTYSTFPIIAKSSICPKFYFSLIPKCVIQKSEFSNNFEIKEYFPLTNNKLYLQHQNKAKETLFCLSDEYTEEDLLLIIKNILNPIGIGAFYNHYIETDDTQKVDAQRFFIPLEEQKQNINFAPLSYMPAPYSMEIVRNLLNIFQNRNFDNFTINCLVALKYQLPNIIIPKGNLNLHLLIHRFIYYKIMLNNSPIFRGDPVKKYLLVQPILKKHSIKLYEKKIEPFQWVHVELYYFGTSQPENDEFYIQLDGIDNDDNSIDNFDLFLDNQCQFSISQPIRNYVGSIMSPCRSNLWLKRLSYNYYPDCSISVGILIK